MGADSLVSQPLTAIMKPKQIASAIQYALVRSNPVRSTNPSRATTPTTAVIANAVYSCTARLSQQSADRLERQQPADRDGDEEHQLLDRHVRRKRPADDVPRIEPPMVTGDGEHVPREEDRDRRDQRSQQTTWTAPHPSTEDELERERHDEARAHQRQVLELVHAAPIVPGDARPARAGIAQGAPVGSTAMPAAPPAIEVAALD